MDEKGPRAIVGCWLAIFIQEKKEKLKTKTRKKLKIKKTRAKGQTLFKFAKNRNGCKRDENFFTRATVGCSSEIFIQEKQIPKTQKKLNKKFAVISFPTNFVTFWTKKLEFLRNFLILNLINFIFRKLKQSKLYPKIGKKNN